jgi:hypothetical protein
MAQTTRLYRIQSKTTGTQRLVEASNPSAARSFVARDEYTVDIPAQFEVFAMAKAGIEIEVVNTLSDETRTAVAQSVIKG